MLVLARHEGESIVILDGLITLKVLSITGKIVRLGFDAPREIPIVREETLKNEQKEVRDDLGKRRDT